MPYGSRSVMGWHSLTASRRHLQRVDRAVDDPRYMHRGPIGFNRGAVIGLLSGLTHAPRTSLGIGQDCRLLGTVARIDRSGGDQLIWSVLRSARQYPYLLSYCLVVQYSMQVGL